MAKEEGRFLPWAYVVSCLGHHQKEKIRDTRRNCAAGVKGRTGSQCTQVAGRGGCFALSSIFESSSIANTLGPSPGRDHSRDYQEDAEQQATMAHTT